MKTIIKTEKLSKNYGKKAVVNQVDLEIREGSIYGFLGPNGAGKSTTMKMMLGLVKPTDGTVRILDRELNRENRLEILKQTGSLIESPSYYAHLSGRENLEIVQTLKGVKKTEIERVLKTVRLENQQNKKVSQYSFGMKQRLGLAAALLGEPAVLLLDEPTNGLDPAGIQEMRDLICRLAKEFGMTILVSSHLLSEIDQMATHIGIIDRGELILQNNLESLHEHSKRSILMRTMENGKAAAVLKEHKIICRQEENQLILPDMEDGSIAGLVTLLCGAGIGVARIEEKQMTLEDIFLKLTGRRVSL